MEEKFDTCKHRSKEKIVYQASPCCGTVYRDGYTCFKLNIEGLTSDICKYCEHYESDEKNEE